MPDRDLEIRADLLASHREWLPLLAPEDATLDSFIQHSTEEMRRELGLSRFASAANTPGAAGS